MVKTIVLCRGLQGSGKTTWANQWVEEDPENRVRFNNDNIIGMFGKIWNRKKGDLARAMKRQFLVSAMKQGFDIVIDNTNLNTKEVDCIKSYAEIHNKAIDAIREDGTLKQKDNFIYVIIMKDFFNVPLKVCISRDSKRPNPVGEGVIMATYRQYKDIIHTNEQEQKA